MYLTHNKHYRSKVRENSLCAYKNLLLFVSGRQIPVLLTSRVERLMNVRMQTPFFLI